MVPPARRSARPGTSRIGRHQPRQPALHRGRPHVQHRRLIGHAVEVRAVAGQKPEPQPFGQHGVGRRVGQTEVAPPQARPHLQVMTLDVEPGGGLQRRRTLAVGLAQPAARPRPGSAAERPFRVRGRGWRWRRCTRACRRSSAKARLPQRGGVCVHRGRPVVHSSLGACGSRTERCVRGAPLGTSARRSGLMRSSWRVLAQSRR